MQKALQLAFVFIVLGIGICLATTRTLAQSGKPGQVIINGQVVAFTEAVPVTGVRYTCNQKGKKEDTATTDGQGRFVLSYTSLPTKKKAHREYWLAVREAATDSFAFSVADRIPIDTSTSVVHVMVHRYPQLSLTDGTVVSSVMNATKPIFSEKSAGNDIRSFIARELNYPEEAREGGIQGTVVVRFTIDETGAVMDPKIVRNVGGGCSEEVLRVINKMPKWIPGQLDGKPTALVNYMPIKFTLE